MAEDKQIMPVWFFIGVLLAIYGIIITIDGVRQLSHPPVIVMAQYHSGLWGGLILLLVGVFYTCYFWPGRAQASKNAVGTAPNEVQGHQPAIPNSGPPETPQAEY